MLRLDADNVYRAPELEACSWLEHGFGTRLSPGWTKGDRLATARQIHSDRVLIVTQPGVAGKGDALVSNQPGVFLAIRTADCLPILIADPRNRAFAAVHAGWRGAIAGVIPNTLDSMRTHFGSRIEDLQIAIGPGIGPCCFEVGPEVAVQFQPYFPDREDLTQKTKVDLAETVIRQLRRNGVRDGRITASGLCTFCDEKRFESYRREREAAGRMVAGIGIREP